MEKKKLKLSITGSSKKTLNSIEQAKTQSKNAVFIEKKPGVKISKDELVDFCKGQISNFKIPRYIVFVNEWPMSSTKVQKFKLKDLDLGEKVFGN